MNFRIKLWGQYLYLERHKVKRKEKMWDTWLLYPVRGLHTRLLLQVQRPQTFLPIQGIKLGFPSYRAHSLASILNKLTVPWDIRHYPWVIQPTLTSDQLTHTDSDKPWRQVVHDACSTDTVQYLNGHIQEIRIQAHHHNSPSQEGLELIMWHTGSRCVNTINHYEMEKQTCRLSGLLNGNTISLDN